MQKKVPPGRSSGEEVSDQWKQSQKSGQKQIEGDGIMIFNVEEKNILALFQTGSRQGTIDNLKMVLGNIEDKELEEGCQHIFDKLTKMSDKEYAALDLKADEEFEFEEG